MHDSVSCDLGAVRSVVGLFINSNKMNSLFPKRKMIKLWRRGFYIRDRATSLHECLEPPKDPRSWKPWFLLLLLIPAAYFLCAYLFNSHPHAYTQYLMPAENVTIKSTKLKHNIQTTTSDPEVSTPKVSESFPVCALNKSRLGAAAINIGNLTKKQVMLNKTYSLVKKGGYYLPPNCHSRHKVGILVPYRNRTTNLAVFLYNIHPFLMNQKLEYRIFVIEQSGNDLFNKGRLYNAGFKEMQKYGKWKCVVFHDVDLLPMDERILYTCPTYPRHMCATVKDSPDSRLSFGGVTSMTLEQYEKSNGYSNMYWGWGGEDDDMFWRLRASGFHVVRYDKNIARFTALPHPETPKNHNRYLLLNTARERWKQEGLSTVEYKVLSVTLRHLSTHIVVDINPYNDNVTVLMSNIYHYKK